MSIKFDEEIVIALGNALQTCMRKLGEYERMNAAELGLKYDHTTASDEINQGRIALKQAFQEGLVL